MISDPGPATDLRKEIEMLLRACRGLHQIKILFWKILGYDRRDEVVSLEGLGSAFRPFVIEARFFASHDKFHLYHLVLTDEGLTRPVLRGLYRSFRRKHCFVALLVGNAGHTSWDLVYQPEVSKMGGSRGHVAMIRLGNTEENISRQARYLHEIKTYDDDDEPLSLIELTTAYNGAFAKVVPHRVEKVRLKDNNEFLIAELAKYPPLTARRERAIFGELDSISIRQAKSNGEKNKWVRMSLDGCAERYQEVRNLLILHNLRLCYRISKKYAIDQDEILEMFQESVFGLHRAIDLFETARNLKFSTYASQWIRQAVVRWIANKRHLIRLPAHLYRLPKEKRHRVNLVALDGDDGSSLELVDASMRFASMGLEEVEEAELIRAALASLSERQATIIGQRFGLDGSEPHTLEQVGHLHGLTRERIRQIQDKALEKLQLRLIRAAPAKSFCNSNVLRHIGDL